MGTDACCRDQILEVVAGLLVRHGRIVLSRRQRGVAAGLWEIPGGKVEAGESWEQALVRELAEELGIQVRECGLWKSIEKRDSPQPIRLTVFQVVSWDGEPMGREGQQVGWFDLQEAVALPLLPVDTAVIAELAGQQRRREPWLFSCIE